MFLLQHTLWVFLQNSHKPVWASAGETFLLIASILAAFGVFVSIIYFFWHGKSREELSKANAELQQLCDIRGKRIDDLKIELSDKKIEIERLKAEISSRNREIENLEKEDERNKKIEFRLRAEIDKLEEQLGTRIHKTE